jgi:glycosyltransferase involved in cell wall biosynthesis
VKPECTSHISVIVPAYNAATSLPACLRAALDARPFEVIVVDDGSTDDTASTARSFGVRLLKTSGRLGPAAARNLGAREARGSILFFVDADVQMYDNTVDRVRETFQRDPSIDAVIGSYDDSPGDRDFLSQYKNLMHCYVHQRGHVEASTFWSGCGAIRRQVFLTHSGFSNDYGRPAIEDIELGYRLVQNGHKIRLDRDLCVKHLKRWTFWGLVKTDILDRGIPWSELILRDRNMPNDLNVQLSQRVSVALVFILLAVAFAASIYLRGYILVPAFVVVFLLLSRYWVDESRVRSRSATVFMYGVLGVICWVCYSHGLIALIPLTLMSLGLVSLQHRYALSSKHPVAQIVFGSIWIAIAAIMIGVYLPRHPFVLVLAFLVLMIVVLNNQFYVFLAGKRGPLFALAAVPFHLLYHFYNGLSFGIGTIRWMWHSVHKAPIPARYHAPVELVSKSDSRF